MENLTEIERIIRSYRSDPRRGFDMIYRSFACKLATYLSRAFNLNQDEIADVVHDTFLPWVENPDRMKSVLNPRAYLFSTAKYLAIQKKRQQGRNIPENDLEFQHQSDDSDGIDTVLTVRVALQALPEEQRETVVLKIWGDLTFEEIAAIQEVSLQTAASRYRYGLQKLKEKLAWNE